MTERTDLAYETVEQVTRAVRAGDLPLGAGDTIVIPDPLWAEASSPVRDSLIALAQAGAFAYRIERRWQMRPPEGTGISRICIERN